MKTQERPFSHKYMAYCEKWLYICIFVGHISVHVMKRIPVKLENCPIIESVLEIRFESDIDDNVVFPILYGAIKDDFKSPVALPVLQIPDNIKKSDPNLRFQPYYRLFLKGDDDVSLQIGPRVIAFSFTRQYKGWKSFMDYVSNQIGKLQTTQVIKRVTRIGFRVINFFEWDIYKKGIELSICLSGETIPYEETALKTKFIDGTYQSVVNIVNSAQLNNAFVAKTGSIIDIDTSTMYCEDFFNSIEKYMNEAHSIEKKIFFRLLTDELISQLIPSYDE